jgi:hypothetical protein
MASVENAAEKMRKAENDDFSIALNFMYFTSEFLLRRFAAFGHTSTVVIPRRKSGARRRAPTPALRNRNYLTEGGLGASGQLENREKTKTYGQFIGGALLDLGGNLSSGV